MMCTRFVYNGTDTVTGFNFDIDLSVWKHKVIREDNRFFIGIRMPDGRFHSFHGINKNGNVGTLLYVHENDRGKYTENQPCRTIADLTEDFVRGELSLDDALYIVENNKIVYAKDASMQAMLSDKKGRVLIIEPGIGYRLERKRYSLLTNYSILSPETTRPYLVKGDDRFERAERQLENCGDSFTFSDAYNLLKSVRQEGIWATRVSFVYSVRKNKVSCVLDNHFENPSEYQF